MSTRPLADAIAVLRSGVADTRLDGYASAGSKLEAAIGVLEKELAAKLDAERKSERIELRIRINGVGHPLCELLLEPGQSVDVLTPNERSCAIKAGDIVTFEFSERSARVGVSIV